MPKDGVEVWFLNSYIEPEKIIFSGKYGFYQNFLNKNLLFPTEEECQKFADHCFKYFEK